MVPARVGYALPLVIAVTGHRDLLLEQIPAIRRCVCDILQALREIYPTRQLRVMSSLAERLRVQFFWAIAGV
jgi:hypothetical protein